MNHQVSEIIEWSTILGVSPTADDTTIRRAYYKKTKSGEYRHTDKGGDKVKFQKLNNAYDGLRSTNMHLRHTAAAFQVQQQGQPQPQPEQRGNGNELRRQEEERQEVDRRRQHQQEERHQRHHQSGPRPASQRQQPPATQPQPQQQHQTEHQQTDATFASKVTTYAGYAREKFDETKEKVYEMSSNAIVFAGNAKKNVDQVTENISIIGWFLAVVCAISFYNFFSKLFPYDSTRAFGCKTLVDEVYCKRSNKNWLSLRYYNLVREWNGHKFGFMTHDSCNCPMCCWERGARYRYGCRKFDHCQCPCCVGNEGFWKFVNGREGYDELDKINEQKEEH